MAYANTFKRREMKFLLDERQYNEVINAVSGFMTEDEFGLHTIMNIYLDNRNNDLIRSSLGKPIYKEKVRLRCYGKSAENDSAAFLEIKKKYRGLTYKRRLESTYKELFDYITDGTIPETRGQVFDELDYLIKRMKLTPKIVICYDRRAFYGNSDREFRLTLDGNIRYRRGNLDLRSGDGGEYLMCQPFRVMEVKSVGAIPLELVRILSGLKIYHGSFSKYGSIYSSEVRQKYIMGV
ncbi:MAG: polyphosphate polymerase domain-containing protein [Oscillospiraceae bacterium]|nr:polyphosphate polymerase domain-containing protein [Oscillospiraceae bacterium]